MKRISRRDLLQTVGGAAVAGALTDLVLAEPRGVAAPKRDGGKPRTIALIGDAAHNHDYIQVSLTRVFKELDLPIDFTTNYYDLGSDMLRPYQLFICFRDNRDAMIAPGEF